jgi:hypothetical protein
MRKEIRDEINRANAEKSTGPKTSEGKQRSAMNAFKHGLTGQSLMLQPNEMEAYNRLTAELLSEFKPKTELERQLTQKIIDGHFRLNRLAAVDNNMFNFGLIQHTTSTDHDDRVEAMVAQTRSWFEQAHAFDVLGRYETRLSRQLHKYTEELGRIQKERIARERSERAARESERGQSEPRGKRHENKRDHFDFASFGRTAPEMVMSAGEVRTASTAGEVGTVSRANSFRVLTHLPIGSRVNNAPPEPQPGLSELFPEAA